MATKQANNLHKKLQRRSNTSKKRQATFIAEYVFIKYYDVYQEAAELFNQLNTMYPKKPDLRTCFEFKNWKRVEQGLRKVRPHVKRDPSDHTIYDDIIIEQPHNELQSVPEDTDTIESLPHKELQLNIPLLNHSEIDDLTLRDDDEVSEQVLEEGGQTQAAEEGGQTQAAEEGGQTQATEEGGQTQAAEEGGQTQAPEEANCGEENDIEPSIFDSISPQTMTELLTELQNDPNLLHIFNDFESFNHHDDPNLSTISNDFESFEHVDAQLDIGVEIEIDDRLERELDVFL